jgi:3-carboxy-cis,cis-muconate cycloisomerase
LSGMSQEHERSAGLWHAEWAVLPEILMLTAGAVARSVDLIENLEVDANRMSVNLEATNGLIFAENVALALATEIGKTEAHHLVEQACKTAVAERQHLKDILRKNDVVSQKIPPSVSDDLFDAKNSIGLSLKIIDRTLG